MFQILLIALVIQSRFQTQRGPDLGLPLRLRGLESRLRVLSHFAILSLSLSHSQPSTQSSRSSIVWAHCGTRLTAIKPRPKWQSICVCPVWYLVEDRYYNIIDINSCIALITNNNNTSHYQKLLHHTNNIEHSILKRVFHRHRY
jgi:hypothetical protein